MPEYSSARLDLTKLLAGWLEPAGNVGGDTFDFALDRGMLHFSMTDAMGRVQRLPLEPGDRLLFFIDGMLERNTTSVDVEDMVAGGATMHPREAVQHLTQAIFAATGGALIDDATAMCLDWQGGPARDRTSHSGANR